MESKDWIKKFRSEKGLSQAQLAKKMNVTKAYVYQYESGNRIPKPETLQRFADALEVPYYWLVVGPPSAAKTKEQFFSSFENLFASIQDTDLSEDEKRAVADSLSSDLTRKALDSGSVSDKDLDNLIAHITRIKSDTRWETQNNQRRKEINDLLNQLNDLGLQEAQRHLEMLVQISKYTEDEKYIELDRIEYEKLEATRKLYEELEKYVAGLPEDVDQSEMIRGIKEIASRYPAADFHIKDPE